MIIKAKVFKVEGKGNMKANASITIDDEFVVGGLRLMEGSKGMFVSMPNYKANDGTYKDISFPLNRELRDEINEKIIAEYKKLNNENVDDTDSSFPF